MKYPLTMLSYTFMLILDSLPLSMILATLNQSQIIFATLLVPSLTATHLCMTLTQGIAATLFPTDGGHTPY